jgi:hypothetical protein
MVRCVSRLFRCVAQARLSVLVKVASVQELALHCKQGYLTLCSCDCCTNTNEHNRVVSVLEGGYGKPSQADDKRYYSKPPPPTQQHQQQQHTAQQPLAPPAPVPVAAAALAAAAAAAAVAAGASTTTTATATTGATSAATGDAPASTSGVSTAAAPFPPRPHSASSSPTSDEEGGDAPQPPDDGSGSFNSNTGYQFVAKHDVQALDRSGLADAVAEHVRSLVDPYRISESALLAQQALQQQGGSGSGRGGRSVSPKPPARGAGAAVKKARPCKY